MVAWRTAFLTHLVIFNTWGFINSFGLFETYYVRHPAPGLPQQRLLDRLAAGLHPLRAGYTFRARDGCRVFPRLVCRGLGDQCSGDDRVELRDDIHAGVSSAGDLRGDREWVGVCAGDGGDGELLRGQESGEGIWGGDDGQCDGRVGVSCDCGDVVAEGGVCVDDSGDGVGDGRVCGGMLSGVEG